MRVIRLFGTTDGSGDVTVTDTEQVTGWIEGIQYSLGTFAAGVDVTITLTSTDSAVAQAVLALTNANANGWYYPRVLEHDTVGSALTTYGRILANGVFKMVVAQGGDTKSGGVRIYMLE